MSVSVGTLVHESLRSSRTVNMFFVLYMCASMCVSVCIDFCCVCVCICVAVVVAVSMPNVRVCL